MTVKLSEGNGGKEMNSLINELKKHLPGSNWTHTDNDAAVLKTDIGFFGFTTDSFIVDPVFFPGGNIGKIAVCGTINDLAMMGIRPSALSLSLVLEEGFPKQQLDDIMKTIGRISAETSIPVVTGDTKVMQRGKVDKIIINTSTIGIADKVLDASIYPGDKIILSGSLGDHAVAVLSERFDFKTSIVSDCKPLWEEIAAIRPFIKQAKDPTRGGLASALNDLAEKNGVSIIIDEGSIKVEKEVRSAVDLLGIDLYSLASEGRFVCITSPDRTNEVLHRLKQFNQDASVIGEVVRNKDVLVDYHTGEKAEAKPEVIIKTRFGRRLLPVPSGNIVPRIC